MGQIVSTDLGAPNPEPEVTSSHLLVIPHWTDVAELTFQGSETALDHLVGHAMHDGLQIRLPAVVDGTVELSR